MAFIGAGDIKLIDQLRDPLKAINQQGQERLQGRITGLSSRQNMSNKASGRVQGEYAPAELARAGTRASRGLEDTLLGALGGASADEQRKQKEHEANLALANEIGVLSAPSLLEEILGGLGGAAKAGGQFASLYKALGSGGGSGYSKNPSYGLSSARNYGLEYPSVPDFGYGR